jgi:hypothetical protein
MNKNLFHRGDAEARRKPRSRSSTQRNRGSRGQKEENRKIRIRKTKAKSNHGEKPEGTRESKENLCGARRIC